MSIENKISWSFFKSITDFKNLSIQFVDDNIEFYTLRIYDSEQTYRATIDKTTPRSSDQADFEDNYLASANKIIGQHLVGRDGLVADVVLKNSRHALVTDASVTVEQVFGFDDFADSWFFITSAGGIGDTVRVQIAAFTDPTGTERDKAAVDVTTTLTATETTDEIALRDLVILDLNADINFVNAGLKATVIKDNPFIHIGSKTLGEEGERPISGDLAISSTGTTTVAFQNSDNDRIIRRGKQNSGARDPRDKRLVTIGVSGEVQAVPGAAGDLFFQNATNDGTPVSDQGGTGSADLLVNGSLGSPDEFFIPPDLEKDIFITELRFYGGGNGIKYGNFLSKNSSLTNGIAVEIISDQETLDFLPLRNTEDFKNKFSFGTAANFSLDIQAGGDQFLAVLLFENPFPIRKAGTVVTGDDRISIFIRDNLNSGISELEFAAFGFRREV